MLTTITFTGADHTVARHRLMALCRAGQFPVEMAFLVSEPRMGSPRYPTMAVASALVDVVRSMGQRAAVHLCGGAARMLFSGGKPGFIPGLTELLRDVQRIQVNVPEELVTSENIHKAQQVLLERVGAKTVIFQWRQLDIPAPPPGVQWLFDVSAGQGIQPDQWPTLPIDQEIGLAGGLGPGRVAPLLAKVNSSASFWIDMESSLRTPEDRFSIDACFKVLEEAASFYATPPGDHS